ARDEDPRVAPAPAAFGSRRELTSAPATKAFEVGAIDVESPSDPQRRRDEGKWRGVIAKATPIGDWDVSQVLVVEHDTKRVVARRRKHDGARGDARSCAACEHRDREHEA